MKQTSLFCMSITVTLPLMANEFAVRSIWDSTLEKPVFKFSDKVRFKPACLAIEAS